MTDTEIVQAAQELADLHNKSGDRCIVLRELNAILAQRVNE